MRMGWAIASKPSIERIHNDSSIDMGGLSRASQLDRTNLLEPARVAHASRAIAELYTSPRNRCGEASESLGLKLRTGDGGCYAGCELPAGLTGDAPNERLFEHRAGILPGRLCELARGGDAGPMGLVKRCSFGPPGPDSFEDDVRIQKASLGP